MGEMKGDTCWIAVMVRSVTDRSFKVFGGHVNYGTNHQASSSGDFYVIPKSQITRIMDLGQGRQVLELPLWLVRKKGLIKHIWEG